MHPYKIPAERKVMICKDQKDLAEYIRITCCIFIAASIVTLLPFLYTLRSMFDSTNVQDIKCEVYQDGNIVKVKKNSSQDSPVGIVIGIAFVVAVLTGSIFLVKRQTKLIREYDSQSITSG